jgi:hypothetical protein
MRRRPILIRGPIRVLSAHPLAASLAPPYLHRVALHLWLRKLRHIRDGRLVGPLIPQLTPAARALTGRHGHFNWWLTTRPCIGWGLPKRKGALSRLAARPLGIGFRFSPPTLRPSPRRLQLLAQFLIFPPQTVDLTFGLLQLFTQTPILYFKLVQPPAQVVMLGAFHCSLS